MVFTIVWQQPVELQNRLFYEVALLELETRARRTGRETSDCNSRERLGRALD